MIGRVDRGGRALLDIELLPHLNEKHVPITVWIDTGFTGDLVIPHSLIADLALEQSGTTLATLADGSEVAMRTFSSHIQWFGEWRPLEVVGNDGKYPLLGVGLLLDRSLHIDYLGRSVTLD